jgi:hypothetical protein
MAVFGNMLPTPKNSSMILMSLKKFPEKRTKSALDLFV